MPFDNKVYEGQQWNKGRSTTWPSDYIFEGYDKKHCLFVFSIDGKKELFAYRKNGYAGWHLIRNEKTYEFCSSIVT